jgi:hypothetical protein
VVYPGHLDHHGTLFGGEALRMMDTADATFELGRAGVRPVQWLRGELAECVDLELLLEVGG